jgi:hypothetical protein
VEGVRQWSAARTSNPGGAVRRPQVGSTPILLRQNSIDERLPTSTASTEILIRLLPSSQQPTGTSSTAPRLIYSAVGTENLEGDLERFLNLHARRDEGSTLGSTDLLARYNDSRRKRGLPTVNQRRFGDTMNALGHSKKLRRKARSPRRWTPNAQGPRYLLFCISRANLAKFSAALGEVVIHSSLSPPVTNSSPLLG